MQAAPAGVLDLLLGPEGPDVEGQLTSAALQEYLHKLDVRREEVLLTLYATAAERFSAEPEEEEEAAGTAAAVAAAAAGADEASLTFSTSLAQLQEQQELAAEDGGAVLQLAQLAAQHAAVLAAIKEAAAVADSVRVAAELQQRLADLDAATAAGSYSEAAWIALELQRAVQAVPGSEDTAVQVAARVEPLQQYLLSAVDSFVYIDPASRMPALLPAAGGQDAAAAADGSSGGGSGTAGGTAATAAMLAEIWKALELFGLLPQALQKLAAQFLEQSVQPILASEADPSLITDSPAGSVASSNLSRATAAGGGRGGSSVERLLYKALRGLTDQVLCGQEELAQQMGGLLWPAVGRAYILTKLKPIQPQSDAEVELYSRKSALGSKLEQKAVKLHLLPAEQEGPITRHIKHTLNKFLNVRRNRFIAAARELLQSAAAQETVTVGVPRRITAADTPKASRALFGSAGKQQAAAAAGAAAGSSSSGGGGGGGLEEEDPLLAGGEYAISKAAQGAVNLMRDALTEAVRSGNTALAQAMCGAVVDVAAMLVLLPPPGAAGTAGSLRLHPAAEQQQAAAAAALEQQQQQQQQLLPYPAALRHNDCHFVFQSLCNLPYLYAPRLQQLVHRSVNFINPANRVRQAGQECLQAMVAQQEAELLGVVSDFHHFSGLGQDGQTGIRCRKAVQQLLHAFRRLGSVLRGMLAPAVLVEVAAQLIQSVCSQIIADIMAVPDISVDESEQIPQVLEPLTAGIHEAVLPPAAAGGTVGGLSWDDVATALQERTPAVMKLREVCELLDIRMVEIRQRWQEGRLPAIGFSAAEVSHLVRALFEDTDLRRDFLRLLAREQQQQEEQALL